MMVLAADEVDAIVGAAEVRSANASVTRTTYAARV
jgi:hypothetical protein